MQIVVLNIVNTIGAETVFIMIWILVEAIVGVLQFHIQTFINVKVAELK